MEKQSVESIERFTLKGIVRDRKTGRGVGGYYITAFDVDNKNERDLLGRTKTLRNGSFLLIYSQKEFIKNIKEGAREGGPDIVVQVSDRFGKTVKETGPLMEASRFEQVDITVDVTDDEVSPGGLKPIKAFKALASDYREEISVLNKAGILSPSELSKADIMSLSKSTGISEVRLKAFRLHCEMGNAESFIKEAATALVAKANIESREQLATASPLTLVKAINAARGDGLISQDLTLSNSKIFGWIGYAKGFDPAGMEAMDIRKVLRDAKIVTDQVFKQNQQIIVVAVSGLLNYFNRLSSMAHLRGLLDEAGVADLSQLGSFNVQGNRVIHPGFYVALPLYYLADFQLLDSMFSYGNNFKMVEAFTDCIRYVTNPVTDSVIIGSLVNFIDNGRLIIGRDVTSLTIITEEIRYSDINEITYEDKERTPANHPQFSPARAETGNPRNDRNVYSPNGGNRGRNGGTGASGQNGASGHDGDTLGPAPNVTIYVQNTPEGLPRIDIGGRRGGAGQAGQHGGNGSDGARGRKAESGLCQCWRGPGWGGDGGRGGNGGNGGRGGAGGSGGSLEINTLDTNIISLTTGRAIDVNMTGGSGGNGGSRGIGGAGGRGGAPGDGSGPWCDDEPSRVGSDGQPGANGQSGANGPRGVSSTFTLQPITLSDWNAVFNQPWITRLEEYYGHVLDTVRVVGRNFTSDTRIVWDGNVTITPFNLNISSGSCEFTVPAGQEGGLHSVVARIQGTGGFVYSNSVSFRVTPVLTSLTPNSGIPQTQITLSGSGFANGASVSFGGTDFTANFIDSTELNFTLPDHETIGMDAGVKQVRVVNPDGRQSNILSFDLDLDIVVRVKTWRVFPDIWVGGGGLFGGPGPDRDEEDVEEIFTDGTTPRQIWIGHNIVLEFDPVVGIAAVPADWASSWPVDGITFADIQPIIQERNAAGDLVHFDEGAINFYFVDDIDDWSTHAYTFRGSQTWRSPAVIFQDTPFLSDWEDKHVAAHEIGHIFGLPHCCGEEAGTTFGRDCSEDNDEAFLMYPFTNFWTDEGNFVSDNEAVIARHVARPWHNL